MRLKVFLIATATLMLVAFASAAYGAPYWFYQGNLPTSSGARTVLVGGRPAPPVYVRESWAPCTHNMKFIMIDNAGNWGGGTFSYTSGCDHEIMDQYPDLHSNYGCQNPDGLSSVWVNCRAGTNP